METMNQNEHLWRKCSVFRDNGILTIGSFVRVACPLPIDSYMRGDIPLLKTNHNAIILKNPSKIGSIPINNEIELNESHAFAYNNTEVKIHYTSPLKTSCSGKFCDHQRVNDWNNSKGCGCYNMNTNSSSLVLQHNITVTTILQGKLEMSDFSSLKFSKLYLSADIPGSCKLYSLQLTTAVYDLYAAMENCVNFINDNGGFTIIGWYKRGAIADKGLIVPKTNMNGATTNANNQHLKYGNKDDDKVQVESSQLSYHIVSIQPSNSDFFDIQSEKYQLLQSMKYDVTDLEATVA